MSAQKKVVLRDFDGGVRWGYLPQSGLLRDEHVEVLGVDGRVKAIVMSEIKHIAYVRDFNLDDYVDPERIGRKSFLGRPRGDGLWVKLGFSDGDFLEGLVDVGLGLLDAAKEDRGVFLAPPEGRGNTLRMYVPRTALRSMEVLGWVTAPSRRPKVGEKVVDETQPGLFPE